MYAVGKLSSYISQGVYTVSGPFHPFGGAVDMVVVQQQDGSLKSSPWYVRFGKFQGVLKAKERVVDINVNGVDVGFNMYLDPRGEAYFLREIDSEEEVVEPVSSHSVSSHSSMCEEIDGKNHEKITVKSKSMNYDYDDSNSVDGKVLGRNNSKRSRILGFVLGRRSMNEHILSKEENDSNVGRMTMEGEIAADLLEMNWSTNFSSRSNMNDCNKESRKDNGEMEITGGRLEGSLVLHEQHFVNKPETSIVDKEIQEEESVSKECSRTRLDDENGAEMDLINGEGPLKIVTKVASNEEGDASVVVSCSTFEVNESNEISPPLESEFQDVNGDSIVIQEVSEQIVEEQFIFSDVEDSKPSFNNTELKVNPPPVKIHQEQSKGENKVVKGNIKRYRSNVDIPMNREITKEEIGMQSKSLPNMWSHFDDPIQDNHEDSQFYSPVNKFRSSNWDLVREDASRIIKANLEKELSQNPDTLTKDLKDGDIANGGGSWSLWPFRRMGSRNVSPKEQITKKDSDIDIIPDSEASTPSSNKHTRSLTPTSEQLASLNLSEGKNTVTFTFSTSVLGPQKVDASIYLWRWDTRIVISDVDGTITKSDVLGQFMPLVGRDWSHIGVTHLFSGIKENGYQMLYLSARAISQASITRQFLFNLKQDGKALPDGPVVISPDGLFPSLFREVIRRAPHEFKIACLEDIKACFPSDRNPFYAGFGNRDTDEFSYVKVGIPKGKIFIINPKFIGRGCSEPMHRLKIICFTSCSCQWHFPSNICA
ncbi:phosphatidate phosphatase PAH2 isoform X2 [Lactuca sativa]|uniref:phosphatidate phosphatase PAH2 isoform X2 n=1 Tax=Lactuca sativa TaxID=4236 RepID=UPI0022B01DA2|nr:phosphatidate phosphatase PAH2 isoform X2 [Lactuca sativa]